MKDSGATMGETQSEGQDAGFTLIELLVYTLLLSFVIMIVGGMIFSAVSASKTVTSITDTSTSGQAVARSVVTGIRNSSDFRLTSPVGDDQLLVSRTASFGDTITWTCYAWYYSADGDGSVRFTASSLAILPPTPEELSQWTLLAEGIKPVTGTGIISALNERLTLSIHGLDGIHPPVDITTSATSRAGASGSLTCF